MSLNTYEKNYVKPYLKKVLNKYFTSGCYLGADFGGDNVKDDYEYIVRFLLRYYHHQDVLIDYLYEKYTEYLIKKKRTPISKLDYERYLKDLGFDTYIYVNDNYEIQKTIRFVCCRWIV